MEENKRIIALYQDYNTVIKPVTIYFSTLPTKK